MRAPYSLFDLTRDNQTVRNRFKKYLVTGELVTPHGEILATVRHLELLADALAGRLGYSVEAISIDETGVRSIALETPSPEQDEPVEVPASDSTLERVRCDLRDLAHRSMFACMTSRGLYAKENPGGVGRFDCDDFADAMAEYLRRQLANRYPSADVKIFFFAWTCPDRGALGHSMPVVIIDGKYYLIDPYSADVMPPHETLESVWHEALRLFMQCPGGIPAGTPFLYPPGDRSPWPAESKPWWHYEDMQRRFCSILTACCAEVSGLVQNESECGPSATNDSPSTANDGSDEWSICDYVPRRTWISPNACGNATCP